MSAPMQVILKMCVTNSIAQIEVSFINHINYSNGNLLYQWTSGSQNTCKMHEKNKSIPKKPHTK